MDLTGVDRLLWATAFIGHCVLLAVLFLRHRATSFPVFTSLIGLNILRSVLLYFVGTHGSHDAYFWTYWILAFIDVALQFAIAYELAAHVFRPLGIWAPDVRVSFSIILPASILFAAALTGFYVPVTSTVRGAIVARADFFSSALMGELFAAMVALSVTIGLPWRTHTARLAQGLGLYAIFGILMTAAHNHFGSGTTTAIFKQLTHIQMVFYLVCLTYWTVTLALPEPASRKLPEHLHQELAALQRRAAMTLNLLR